MALSTFYLSSILASTFSTVLCIPQIPSYETYYGDSSTFNNLNVAPLILADSTPPSFPVISNPAFQENQLTGTNGGSREYTLDDLFPGSDRDGNSDPVEAHILTAENPLLAQAQTLPAIQDTPGESIHAKPARKAPGWNDDGKEEYTKDKCSGLPGSDWACCNGSGTKWLAVCPNTRTALLMSLVRIRGLLPPFGRSNPPGKIPMALNGADPEAEVGQEWEREFSVVEREVRTHKGVCQQVR
ncbi:hypothetical protein MMC07_001326 [Pseudocyphellaria aurata]|nr:hypothetical protein [Pseudocyphellaria aurata]